MRKRILRSVALALSCGGLAFSSVAVAADPPMAVKDAPAPVQATPAVQPVSTAQPLGEGACGNAGPACNAGVWSGDASASDDRFWIGGEYLMWWIRQGRTPALVTAGAEWLQWVAWCERDNHSRRPRCRSIRRFAPVPVSPPACGSMMSRPWAWKATILSEQPHRGSTFSANGQLGSPIISRPFVNALTGQQDIEAVSFPGLVGGGVSVSADSRLQGSELNGLCNLCTSCNYRVDLLGGFRYLQLNEGLAVSEDLNVNPTVPSIGGGHFDLTDRFGAPRLLLWRQRGRLRPAPLRPDLRRFPRQGRPRRYA